jgi:chromosome partitioning protein
VAADWFIIPVFPSKFDLNGLAKLTVSINEIRDLQNENLKLAGILVGNFAKGIKLDAQVYKFLQDKFGPNTVFETTISRAKNMREMVFYNQTIFEFAETAEQAEDFLTLAKEMINRAMKGQSTTRPLPDLQSVVETATTSEAKLDLSGLENTQPVTEEIPEAANG